MKAELGNIQQAQRNQNCGLPEFLGGGNAARCSQLDQRFNQLSYQLSRLENGTRQWSQRLQSFQKQYQRLGCGQPNAPQDNRSRVQVERQGHPKTLFDLLFGGNKQNAQKDRSVVEQPNEQGDLVENPGPQQSGRYRTLCVRSCDGYFYPISFSTSPNTFERDSKICAQSCPNQNVSLFIYANPGGSVDDMVGLDGTPYSATPTAFRFQNTFDQSCRCGEGNTTAVLPQSRDYGALKAVEELSKQDLSASEETPLDIGLRAEGRTAFQSIKTDNPKDRDEAMVLKKIQDERSSEELIIYLNHLYGHPRDRNEIYDTAGQQMRVEQRGGRDAKEIIEDTEPAKDVRVVLPWLGERSQP